MINEQLQDTSEKSIGFLILIPLLLGSWLLVTSLMEAIPELGVYNGKRILELYLRFAGAISGPRSQSGYAMDSDFIF